MSTLTPAQRLDPDMNDLGALYEIVSRQSNEILNEIGQKKMYLALLEVEKSSESLELEIRKNVSIRLGIVLLAPADVLIAQLNQELIDLEAKYETVSQQFREIIIKIFKIYALECTLYLTSSEFNLPDITEEILSRLSMSDVSSHPH